MQQGAPARRGSPAGVLGESQTPFARTPVGRPVARVPVLLAAALLGAIAASAAGQTPGAMPPHPLAANPVAVAVLDSGIDSAHDDFSGRTIERHSFVQPTVPTAPGVPGLPIDPFTLQPDPDGQGTGVASRVAGKTYSANLTSDAGLVDLQVSGKYTNTQLDPATEAAAAEAMDWLLANHGGNGSAGPRIALLSFANHDLSGAGAETIAASAEKLWKEGVLVIVPAGGNSTLHSSRYTLTVGMASDGDCGHPTAISPALALKPDVSAIGRDVTVAFPKLKPTDSEGNTRRVNGTSYAAAAVASAAAKVWAERDDLPLAALTAILRNTASDKGAPGPDGCTGFGAVDAAKAVDAALAWRDPAPTDELSKPTPAWGMAGPVVALGLLAVRRRSTAGPR